MTLEYESAVRPRRQRQPSWLIPSAGVVLFFLGGIVSGIVSYLMPRSVFFCFPAVYGAIATPILDALFVRRLHSGKGLRHARAALLFVVAFALSWMNSISPATAFEQAFTVPPPAGVSNLHVRCRGAGPGDTITLIRFTANRAAIDQLVAARKLELQKDKIDDYKAGSVPWNFLWMPFASFSQDAGEEWSQPNPAAAPELYRWDSGFGSGKPLRSTELLYDPATGEAYVLYLFG